MRNRYWPALLAAVCMLLLCGCGGEAPESPAVPSETAVPAETPAPTAEGYDVLGGTWAVGGIQMRGQLFDIHDYEALEDLYDTTFLTFNEDGTFVYFNVAYSYRGTYRPHGEPGSYLLDAKSSFTYKMEKGELVQKETALEKTVQYLVTMNEDTYGDDAFVLHEYDSLMGKAKAEELLLLFVPEEGESGYVADNKTPLTADETEEPETQSEEKSSAESAPSSANATRGEVDALEKAREYLNAMAFSYTGLIDQLEYEGFTAAEAAYGADHCGADWKEQAAEKAREYLASMAFSYNGLVEQLEYEGFTHEQAVYGVDRCGADWERQAVEKARNYRDVMSFSRQELIEQLEYEGFTHAQAVYGADNS